MKDPLFCLSRLFVDVKEKENSESLLTKGPFFVMISTYISIRSKGNQPKRSIQ